AWTGNSEYSLLFSFFGLGDLYWTISRICIKQHLPRVIESHLTWLSVYFLLSFFLKLNSGPIFPYISFLQLLFIVFDTCLFMHTDLTSTLTHQQDIDHLWAEIKVIRNGIHDLIDIPIDTLVGGEFALVQIGDLFPTDGTITSGATLVDDSWLDGKTQSAPKYEGDQILAGSRNLTASVLMLTTCSRKNSLFNKIHENLLSKQTHIKTQREFTIPVLPFMTFIILSQILDQFLRGHSVFTFSTVQLSLERITYGFPFLGFIAIALADSLTRRKILEEHPEIHISQLSCFSNCIRKVFFKKEFLTRRRALLSDIITLPSAISIELTFHSSFSKGAVLLIASSIQRHVNPELAQALFDVYIPHSTQKKPKEAIEVVSSMLSFSTIDHGQGIETCFRGSKILMGNPGWISQRGKVDLSTIREWIDTSLIKGEHVEVMSLEGAVIAAFAFTEQCLPNVCSILDSIKQANCEPVLCVDQVKGPFAEELRLLFNLDVIQSEDLPEIISKLGKKAACIERPSSDKKELYSSCIEIGTLKERTSYYFPIQIVPQKEEHVGIAICLINKYVHTRDLNIFFSHVCGILSSYIPYFLPITSRERFFILFQLLGVMLIGINSKYTSRSRF
uniref:P-type ATPase n=1 Tax=Candidatus Similichlamydia epinepheli TaxID=1903953 RepID=UPI001300876A